MWEFSTLKLELVIYALWPWLFIESGCLNGDPECGVRVASTSCLFLASTLPFVGMSINWDIVSTMKGNLWLRHLQDFFFFKSWLCSAHHYLMEHNTSAIKQLFGFNHINLFLLFSQMRDGLTHSFRGWMFSWPTNPCDSMQRTVVRILFDES